MRSIVGIGGQLRMFLAVLTKYDGGLTDDVLIQVV